MNPAQLKIAHEWREEPAQTYLSPLPPNHSDEGVRVLSRQSR